MTGAVLSGVSGDMIAQWFLTNNRITSSPWHGRRRGDTETSRRVHYGSAGRPDVTANGWNRRSSLQNYLNLLIQENPPHIGPISVKLFTGGLMTCKLGLDENQTQVKLISNALNPLCPYTSQLSKEETNKQHKQKATKRCVAGNLLETSTDQGVEYSKQN